MIYLDTHVLVWLFLGELDRIPTPGLQRLDQDELMVSPMAALELEYLFEVGRATSPATDVLTYLQASVGLRLCDLPFAEVAREAMSLTWTRDPFDRMICAQAQRRGEQLLTCDHRMLLHSPAAWWPESKANSG